MQANERGDIIISANDNINEIPQQGLTIIDFWAEWCTSCKNLEPQIKAIASELERKIGSEQCSNLKQWIETFVE